LVERLIAARDQLVKPVPSVTLARETMAEAANALTAIEVAARDGKSALAAWDRYQPNVCRADTIEQAIEMASALRLLVAALDTKQEA
jgi:hypothetical protein